MKATPAVPNELVYKRLVIEDSTKGNPEEGDTADWVAAIEQMAAEANAIRADLIANAEMQASFISHYGRPGGEFREGAWVIPAI